MISGRASAATRSPLDDVGLFLRGLDTYGEPPSSRQQQPSPRGHEMSHRCRSSGRSKASPTVEMAAASCWRSSLKAAFCNRARPEWPVMARDVSSESRSCTSCVMNCRPRRCFLARLAMLTMNAAPSGCCMMDQTSSTTSRRGLGFCAAAVHTVSVQTIAAAGRSSGSSSRKSKTVTEPRSSGGRPPRRREDAGDFPSRTA